MSFEVAVTDYFDNVMMKFIANNKVDAWKLYIDLFL